MELSDHHKAPLSTVLDFKLLIIGRDAQQAIKQKWCKDQSVPRPSTNASSLYIKWENLQTLMFQFLVPT